MSRRDRKQPRALVLKRPTFAELREGHAENPPIEDIARPRTRGECVDGPRPCPFVGCKYNLYLDINPETGSIKINFPSLDPWEMTSSCALDVADAGEHTLEAIGELMNLTRERTRQIEARVLLGRVLADFRKKVV